MKWALADGWTITRRDLIHWGREPGSLLFHIFFLVLVTLIFAYLLAGAMMVPGGGDYREYLMPGMFVMNMLFGAGTTMTAVAEDVRKGVTDRFRSMPMSPSAVLLGRSVADLIEATVVTLILMGVGLLIGWRINGTVEDTIKAILLLLLLRFAFVWLGIFIGLIVSNQSMATAVQTMAFPIGFLSSAFIPPATMPGWLGTIAEWNPVSSTVTATRELFGNPGMGGDSWITQNAMLMAVVWPLVILAIFFPLAVNRYQKLNH